MVRGMRSREGLRMIEPTWKKIKNDFQVVSPKELTENPNAN
jgi:hypothetical protein